jgi:hypothetical protein
VSQQGTFLAYPTRSLVTLPTELSDMVRRLNKRNFAYVRMGWGTENAYKNAGKHHEPLKEDARIETTPDRPSVVMVMTTGSRHTEPVQLWCPLIPVDGRTRVLRIPYVSRLDFFYNRWTNSSV